MSNHIVAVEYVDREMVMPTCTYLLQEFCQTQVPCRSHPSTSGPPVTVKAPRKRLLSDVDRLLLPESAACSVEDVLQLLQMLFAISQDASIDKNLSSM